MEKKIVGIFAGVAAIHVVALAGLMASGGCRQPAILGTQTYNDGPAMEKVPSAWRATFDTRRPTAANNVGCSRSAVGTIAIVNFEVSFVGFV